MPAAGSAAVPSPLLRNGSHSSAKILLLLSSLVPQMIGISRAAPAGTVHVVHGGADEGVPSGNPWELVFNLLIIAGLVLLGGIFAGLTLGLMGLDHINLTVLASSGTPEERKAASKVLNLLNMGRHWCLVVLLLGNVIVNESLPIFLSVFGSGLTAVLTSTALIVIFGEIIPQSICARHGLAIGAFCAPLVRIVMWILSPVAWPIAKLLDWALGQDHGTTYRKAELKTLVSLHQQIGTDNLNEDEVTIIRAVLDLNDKTVEDVMTPIDDVFCLSSDAVLDEKAIQNLVHSGYSRVPIYESGKPENILGMLLVKKLITYDPEDCLPVSHFPLTPLPEASPELSLLDCLNYFQQGRSHMVLVSKNPGEQRGAMGVVTLEDIIEEMIGEEIIDETDVFVDVHSKIQVRRSDPRDNAPGAAWAPLLRGIIERRRKYGGPQRAPMRKAYGTMNRANSLDHDVSASASADTPRAFDKVVKKMSMPTTFSTPSSPTINGSQQHYSQGSAIVQSYATSPQGARSPIGGVSPSPESPYIVEAAGPTPRIVPAAMIVKDPAHAGDETRDQDDEDEGASEGKSERKWLLGKK